MRVLQLLALGAPLAAAIAFSNPAENATLTRGATFDLSWTSVDTDPTAFSVYLVNFVNWPPYYQAVDFDLDTSTGEASVRVPCDVDDAYGYQFNAINGTNVYIIYAQTPKFSITGDSCTDPAPTGAATTCAAAPTVTVTVRGNSSSSPTTTTTAAPVGLVALAAASNSTTVEGACPSIIGWNGNYSNPVTLKDVPHAGRRVVATSATAIATGGTALPTAASTYGAGHGGWNTTLTVPTSAAATATATATGAVGLAAERVTTKGCSKKRQTRKRHSDGNGKVKPAPMRR